MQLLEEPIDLARRMKVVFIGAGYSGVAAGCKLPLSIPNLELTIYDKNGGIGGTWFENKYPGLACDIPAHCYQYTFAQNTQWSAFYAPGNEIRQYLCDVAEKYGVQKLIKFHHELIKATWSEQSGKWELLFRCTTDGSEVRDDADVVITGMGGLNRWKWPDIEGIKEFKGKLLHSACWEAEDVGELWGNHTVAVIGCGSSGTQIVPALQPHVKRLDTYVRGRTYITAPFGTPLLDKITGGKLGSIPNYIFSDDEKAKFAADPAAYYEFRKELEDLMNSVHAVTDPEHKIQTLLRGIYKRNMEQKLAPKPEILEHLMPDFPLSCRRSTPGPGYLEALVKENVDFIPGDIKRITDTGIVASDGKHREYDVIVAATGFDTSYRPRFPIIGENGVNLQDQWSDYPKTYLSMCQDNFPNWFQVVGPNSTVATGSLVILMERELDYITECILKMQRERIKAMAPKPEAVRDFQEYVDSYFPRTVFSKNCRSWYKMGKAEGRVVALWPGSSLHAVRAFERPRFEDFNYVSLDTNTHNRLHWLGNGFTYAEATNKVGERAWYLNDEPSVRSGAVRLDTYL